MHIRAQDPKLRRLFLLADRLVHEIIAGNYRSIFKGQGIEFDETREYTYGDDARLIDWNVSARRGSPHTKVFREERELTLFFIVDTSASVFFASGGVQSVETASRILTLLALAASSNMDKVGALLFNDKVEHFYPPRKDYRHILNIVSSLEKQLKTASGTRLDIALRSINRFLKKRGICVIVSDFKTQNYERELSILVKKHDVIAIKLNDETMYKLPKIGSVPIFEPERGFKTLLYTNSLRYRQQAKDFWTQHHKQWVERCKKLGVAHLSIGNNEDPIPILLRFFKNHA